MCSISLAKHNRPSSLEAVSNWWSTVKTSLRTAQEKWPFQGKRFSLRGCLKCLHWLRWIFPQELTSNNNGCSVVKGSYWIPLGICPLVTLGMKTPECSHTSRVSQIVQSFCPKVLDLFLIERHKRFTRKSADTHTERRLGCYDLDC